ncbi:butyrophilin subfamily 3 member A2-like isoform X3 [Micropterus salmoides]|uniref:butyrophilin subfamily 3 member A2-like isoform X3 n=1 Tax=Micropterus salmoides TaxID=27706 RepID=UPI0018EA59BE|nr:butyrophilin subfamily 3 member A2-like isoform X3 [Micropterus salmoides]
MLFPLYHVKAHEPTESDFTTREMGSYKEHLNATSTFSTLLTHLKSEGAENKLTSPVTLVLSNLSNMLQLKALELLFFWFCLLTVSGITPGHMDTNGSGDVRVVVKEGSDAILPCSLSTKENAEEKLFDWKKDGRKEIFFYDGGLHYNNGRIGQDQQFKGRVSHFQDELKYGNASIIIRNTKVTDRGDYTCDFPRLQPRQIFNIQLVVDLTFRNRLNEITGAAAEPSITIVDVTEFGVLLQCEVRGAFPKPTVEWQDSAGNKLPAEEPQVSEREGHFYITLQTTVTKTKTNQFHCVVQQDDIGHMISNNITLPEKLFEDTYSKGVVAGLFGGFSLGALTVGAVLVLLVATKIITVLCNKGAAKQKNRKKNKRVEESNLQAPLGSCVQENGFCRAHSEEV